jgi:hypothetical protein
MTDDEILQLASKTSGAHYMDHAHVIRFARAVIAKAAIDRKAMQMALDALEQSRPLTSEDDFVLLVRQHQEAISALRAALGEKE